MTEYPESFETLWSKYPERNGRKIKKLPAFKKWNVLDAGQKAALFSSVEKHNRNHSWGKYIRDLVTYINQAGWEDSVSDQKTAFKPQYRLAEPPYECSKWHSLANRWLLSWLRAIGGLPDNDVTKAVKIKTDTVNECGDDLDKWDFVNLLLTRLDVDFERQARPILLKGASNGTD